MSETSAESATNEFPFVVVRVGYCGGKDERHPVRFRGREVCKISTQTINGPNESRWHCYRLYECPPDSNTYRVLDDYHTCWQGESNHSKISGPLSDRELVRQYPMLANKYLSDEYLAEIAIDLDAGETIPGEEEDE